MGQVIYMYKLILLWFNEGDETGNIRWREGRDCSEMKSNKERKSGGRTNRPR